MVSLWQVIARHIGVSILQFILPASTYLSRFEANPATSSIIAGVSQSICEKIDVIRNMDLIINPWTVNLIPSALTMNLRMNSMLAQTCATTKICFIIVIE